MRVKRFENKSKGDLQVSRELLETLQATNIKNKKKTPTLDTKDHNWVIHPVFLSVKTKNQQFVLFYLSKTICHISLTGHAFEPVLKVEDFVMSFSIRGWRWVPEFFIGFLYVCFTPG